MLVLWLNFAVIKVGSISDCTDGNGGWEGCSSRLMMEKIPQLELFPAGQDEFSARISGQAEDRAATDRCTSWQTSGWVVGRHAFSWIGTKESWESSSSSTAKGFVRQAEGNMLFFHSHALNAGQSVVFKVHFIISRSVHRFLVG